MKKDRETIKAEFAKLEAEFVAGNLSRKQYEDYCDALLISVGNDSLLGAKHADD